MWHGLITELTAGAQDYAFAGWLFLRLLGVIYAVAFLSLAVQIKGLSGSRGILPARESLAGLRFSAAPTIFWWHCTDGFLTGVCWSGVLCSVLLIAGFAPVLMLAILWAAYLSLYHVNRLWLGYQWDVLLLEVGFLAIFFTPLEWWSSWP